MKKPDYSNSILNITSSIMKQCGVAPYHATLPQLDEVLVKGYDNIVFMLFDGMGSDCLAQNIDSSAFMPRHKRYDISSVCPSTTTAATTSIHTGRSPYEHGWIGWGCYFHELDRLVNLFTNDDGYLADRQPLADHSVAFEYMPFVTAYDTINESCGEYRATHLSAFSETSVSSLEDLFGQTQELCSDGQKRFVSTYWTEPDHTMHELGCYHDTIVAKIAQINDYVEKLCSNISNTVVIITADHGLIDDEAIVLDEYPELFECLRHPIAVEPRCASLYIYPDRLEFFRDEFQKRFGEYFVLYSKEEFLANGFLGDGEPSPKTLDFVGDYMAVAIGSKCLNQLNAKGDYNHFRARHAGMTEKEMIVPLIIIER